MTPPFALRTGSVRGFTLLELLMVIGLMGLLLSGLYGFFDRWSQSAVDRMAAADMKRVQTAALEYVSANFEALKTNNIGVFQAISLATLRNGNYLPTGFQGINAYKQPITVYRRSSQIPRLDPATGAQASDNAGNLLYYYTIEVVAASGNPASGTLRVAPGRLAAAARAGGPSLGLVYTGTIGATVFTNRVRGLTGTWSINRSDIQSAGYTATPTATGGYLAAYGIVALDNADINDDYLYRLSINGHPELNRMETNLNMNSQPLQSAGTVVADRFNVTGDAAFLGKNNNNAANQTSNAMSVDQALRIAGTNESRINMKDSRTIATPCTLTDDGTGNNNRKLTGTGCVMTGGELQVVSTGSVDATLNTSDVSADGNIITNNATISTQTNAKGRSSFTDVTGASLNNTGNVVAPTTNVTGTTITTQELHTGSMAVSAASTTGAIIAARLQPNTGHSFTSNTLNIANTATITGNLQAHGLNATARLLLNNASGTYTDTVMGRNVVCTAYAISGKTYTFCEPSGTHTWGNGDVETCHPNSTLTRPNGSTYKGYYCDFVRSGVYIGTCKYSRAKSVDGRAIFDYEGCA